MGRYAIKMPDIGEGIAEVELVAWKVQPGDTVQEDQVIAEVMTDKAAVEIPSPVAGQVVALGGTPGTMMAVGSELIRLEVEGVGNVKGDAPAQVATPPTGATTAIAPDAATSAPVAAPTETRASARPAEPPASSSSPTSHAPAPPSPAPRAATRRRTPGEKPLASPAVRRRAWDLGIELQFVAGSGPAGRIEHADLDAWQAGRRHQADTAPRARERHGEEPIPVIGLRRAIAQKMQESKRRIPHFSYVEEIDVTELDALRVALNGRHAEARGKLTLLPLIARAVVQSVLDFPMMNARYDDDAGVVVRHAPAHLGIATQTPGGLMVPVVRHAESLDPWAFSREVTRLAEAARTGKATRDELSGSTITITSLGALGGIVTTPVINHPEVAIVGVNRVVERPAFRGTAIVPRLLMNLSSSFDHRVVDGMEAARFVQAIRALLEQPALLFVD
jgi:2-oxoisovalerate dehydrogenase E2 component (dihydrolipoyl transacylase)